MKLLVKVTIFKLMTGTLPKKETSCFYLGDDIISRPKMLEFLGLFMTSRKRIFKVVHKFDPGLCFGGSGPMLSDIIICLSLDRNDRSESNFPWRKKPQVFIGVTEIPLR